MLVGKCRGGIGNRLKNMMSVARLDDDFKIFWTYKDWVLKNTESNFDDLFNMPERITTRRGHRGVWYRDWLLAETDEDRSLYHLPEKRPGHGGYIDFGFETIPKKIINDYLNAISKIKFNEKVLKRVEEFCAENISKDTLGVQIRSWPECKRGYFNGKFNSWPEKFCIKKFENEMNKHNGKYFITSDQPKWIYYLKQKFDERIIVFDFDAENNSYIGKRNAMTTWLCDLLILAQCNNMVLSVDSTFGEVAWWFGGACAKVNMIGTPQNIEKK